MGRKKQTSALDDAFDLFKLTPFWVGPIFAFVAFWCIRTVVPRFFQPSANGMDVGVFLRKACPMLSWFALIGILMAWGAAELHKLSNRRLLNKQTGIDSIRSLSWRDFEHLISEYYRRKGFLAEVVGRPSGDGGVDILLTGRGERVLVQCKQWKAFKVPVQPVRELLGVVVSQGANRGILVTSGRYTAEARQFGDQNRMLELVDGEQLENMIRSVQSSLPPGQAHPSATAVSVPNPKSSPVCSACGSPMILRTAKRGSNAGSQFWGCSGYPRCRTTLPVRD